MGTEKMLGSNDIIIGQTTICEAARLIASPPANISLQKADLRRQKIFRLLEFCALVEAVVLHDTLATLPANLATDVEELELRKRLLSSGILREFPSSILSSELVPVLTKWMTNTKDLKMNEAISEDIKRPSVSSKMSVAFLEACGFNDLELGKSSERELIEQQINSLQKENMLGEKGLIDEIRFNIVWQIIGSGTYDFSVSALRSMLYWHVADKMKLPWYPDVMRVPLMLALNQKLRTSLTDQVYSVVAKAFNTNVDELLKVDLPYEAAMPPFGALLLSRCSSREHLINEIFVLRDEFADFRRNLGKIEQHRRNAKSIKELRDARTQRDNFLKAIAAKYEESDQSIIDTALGYAPDVLNILENPFDPGRYKSELLKKPYEWIRNWWNRRPASRLFSVTKKLERIELYGQLVPRILGFDITAEDVTFIREYHSKVQFLLTT